MPTSPSSMDAPRKMFPPSLLRKREAGEPLILAMSSLLSRERFVPEAFPRTRKPPVPVPPESEPVNIWSGAVGAVVPSPSRVVAEGIWMLVPEMSMVLLVTNSSPSGS